MKVAIVDDVAAQAAYLRDLLVEEMTAQGIPLRQVDLFPDGESFLARWSPGEYDLVILDILMKQVTGVDVARSIRRQDSQTQIVFCTASNAFAAESYEVNALYYIKKPVTSAGVAAMITRLDPEQLERIQPLYLPDGYAVLVRQILYTEHTDHAITFYMKEGNNHHVRLSCAEAKRLLEPYDYFYSPVVGCIINFHEVLEMRSELFIMSNGTRIPIARRRRKGARDAYAQFCLEQRKREVLQ